MQFSIVVFNGATGASLARTDADVDIDGQKLYGPMIITDVTGDNFADFLFVKSYLTPGENSEYMPPRLADSNVDYRTSIGHHDVVSIWSVQFRATKNAVANQRRDSVTQADRKRVRVLSKYSHANTALGPRQRQHVRAVSFRQPKRSVHVWCARSDRRQIRSGKLL